MQILLKGFQCLRCGHQWKPRKKTTPQKCPACDSARWQIPPGETMPPHLEEVFQQYEVPPDQKAEIVRYAAQHPGVATALLVAVPELEKVFGKARLSLDLFQFWDSEGEVGLFGLILLKDYPDNSFEMMDQFLEAWIPQIPKGARTHVNFNIARR